MAMVGAFFTLDRGRAAKSAPITNACQSPEDAWCASVIVANRLTMTATATRGTVRNQTMVRAIGDLYCKVSANKRNNNNNNDYSLEEGGVG
jgi:hypothetical protein